MKPLNGLQLIFSVLRTQAVHGRAQRCKLSVVVAIGARLGRAAACPGDGIPRFAAARRLLIGTSRSWVAKDNQPSVTLRGQIDRESGRRFQPNRWEHRPTKVITRSIVFRDGQVLRKGVEIVCSHIANACRSPAACATHDSIEREGARERGSAVTCRTWERVNALLANCRHQIPAASCRHRSNVTSAPRNLENSRAAFRTALFDEAVDSASPI